MEAVEALLGGVRNAEGERFGIKVAAADTRRNIATSSVPLNHLVDREFWVGAVLMRGTRLCEPCKHLDDLTLHGVMSGLIHRGGLRERGRHPRKRRRASEILVTVLEARGLRRVFVHHRTPRDARRTQQRSRDHPADGGERKPQSRNRTIASRVDEIG